MNSEVIDPRDFRSFCFRGEGRANVVISAVCKSNGIRIVWRFAKARKKGILTLKSKSALVNEYMEVMVAPFFSPGYLVEPSIIEMSVEDAHHVAKVPNLPANYICESFDQLLCIPAHDSLLPLEMVPNGMTRITALKMLDATTIPQHIKSAVGPIFTVEIKPKQGFFQIHPGIGLPYCNNCVLQMEKCGSDYFEQMYDFCPLDLFSGSRDRTVRALRELFRVPHRNLRVFKDGKLVHSNEKSVQYSKLQKILFPQAESSLDDVVDTLSLALTGSKSFHEFYLHENSVLEQILRAQRIDPVGIVQAYKIYQSLPASIQRELLDKSRLPVSGLHILEKTDNRSLIERYLLAATMKDCSVMASLQVVDPCDVDESYHNFDNIVTTSSGSAFAFSIKIVDLDPKSPKNLLNGYSRFMAGVKMIRIESDSPGSRTRNPCIST